MRYFGHRSFGVLCPGHGNEELSIHGFCNSIKLGLGFGILESHVRMQLYKGEARPGHSTEGCLWLCFGPYSCGVRINGTSSL